MFDLDHIHVANLTEALAYLMANGESNGLLE
jgi:hypothetical protein